ncbi:hypothetical protein [Paraburkholderia diazotrophica]|uniref:hypothetical protein n=1 Tax=Paraburkholderia diazotrophica TaxID=667676 RepID=UPI003177A797
MQQQAKRIGLTVMNGVSCADHIGTDRWRQRACFFAIEQPEYTGVDAELFRGAVIETVEMNTRVAWARVPIGRLTSSLI